MSRKPEPHWTGSPPTISAATNLASLLQYVRRCWRMATITCIWRTSNPTSRRIRGFAISTPTETNGRARRFSILPDPANSPATEPSPNTPPKFGMQLRAQCRRGPDMINSPLAGKPAPKDILVDLARLEREYCERRPDPDDPTQ